MTASQPDWKVRVQAGDRLRLNATYDSTYASWYETMGIMMAWIAPGDTSGVDPFEQVTTHRPRDYWGRNLIDHLIGLLPEALADDGTAYLMQLSIIGEKRTMKLLDRLGYQARVVDFGFFEFSELFTEASEQIARVVELSDAYHVRIGDTDVMVAYLLEVTRKR